MADIRESFPILEGASGAGEALAKMNEGDSPSTKNGAIGFSFKDSSGNVVLPQLTAAGKLPVDIDETNGTYKKAAALLAGTAVEATVAEITLTADAQYLSIHGRVSSFAESIFRLLLSDNGVETVLDYALVGPGQFTVEIGLPKLEATAGSTGVQKLIIKGKNLAANKLSDMRASLEAVEVV